MKHTALIVALVAILAACSKQDAESASNNKAAAPAAPAEPAAAPNANMPGMAAGGNMGGAAVPAGHPGMAEMGAPAPVANKYEGTVKSVTHAAGYTYVEVDDKGKSLWIASMPVNIQKGDKVAWGDGAVMNNFESKALHRTFDSILFVNAVTKVN